MAEGRSWPPKVNLFQVAIAIVVVSAVFIGYVIATLPPAPPAASQVAKQGDQVEVDYIGFFANGRVFDTSLEGVAQDNATYPKAFSFQSRSTYTPLKFTITGLAEEVIAGFEEGVIGMKVGETKVIEVPPEKGYGVSNPALFLTRPLVVELPQLETIRVADFQGRFRTVPMSGLTVKEPLWGWDVTVTSLSTDFVTIAHLPTQGMIVQPFTWLTKVTKVDTSANQGKGLIVVEHLLNDDDVEIKGGEDGQGTFRVVAVDRDAGTYTVDYNSEVTGKTLFFQVTLRRIIPAGI